MAALLRAFAIGLYLYFCYCWFTLLWWAAMSIYTQHLVSLSMFDAVSVVVGIIGFIDKARSKE